MIRKSPDVAKEIVLSKASAKAIEKQNKEKQQPEVNATLEYYRAQGALRTSIIFAVIALVFYLLAVWWRLPSRP
jgi:hypothetical protein